MTIKKKVSGNFSHALFSLSTHDDLAIQALLWLYMVRFRAIGSALHTQIEDDLKYRSIKFMEQTSPCIPVNTVHIIKNDTVI